MTNPKVGIFEKLTPSKVYKPDWESEMLEVFAGAVGKDVE